MHNRTENEISSMLERVAFCAIKLSWKSDNPLPGVGERKSSYVGAGQDFTEFTLFEEGDDVRDINWALTASSPVEDEIWKTIYQEEKEVNSFVLVKVGHSMDYGSAGTTKRGLAAQMTASILFALDKTRDKAGLVVYSRDGIIDDLNKQSAMQAVYPGLTKIIEAEPYKATGLSKGDGLAKALSALPPSRSLVWVVSDFLDMSKKDWDELAEMALFHDVICIYVQDRREIELPKTTGFFGRIGWFYNQTDVDGNTRLIWNNAKTRRSYTENFRRHETEVLANLSKRMCECLTVVTDRVDADIPRVLDLFSSHQ